MPAQRADRLSNGVKERILETTQKAVGAGPIVGKRSFPGPTSRSIYRHGFHILVLVCSSGPRCQIYNTRTNVPLRACGVERGLKWVESLECVQGPRLSFGVWLAAPQVIKSGLSAGGDETSRMTGLGVFTLPTLPPRQ